MEIWDILAKNLKEYRDHYNLTQADLAKIIGLRLYDYKKIEQGDARTKIDVLDKISAAINISSKDLLDDDFKIN